MLIYVRSAPCFGRIVIETIFVTKIVLSYFYVHLKMINH